MARDGSGVYNRTQNDYVFGEIISETEVNSEFNDIASALTQSLSKDGQTVPTANLPMGSFKLTGLGNGSARTDSVTVGQVQDSSFMWGGTAGGTSDALTIAPSPAITAYAAGQAWRLINQGTPNATTTPTIAISGLANRTIKRRDGSAIVPGDLAASSILDLVDDGTALRLVNFTGGSLAKAVNTARSTVASAATTADIWGAANQIDWTGTTTCTGFPAAPQAGVERVLICAAAAPFTAGANMLIDGVTSGNTVTCAANDIMIVRAVTTTQFRLSRVKYDGAAQVSSMTLLQTVTASSSATVDLETGIGSQFDDYLIIADGVRPATDTALLYCRLKIAGAYSSSNYFYHQNVGTSSSAAYAGSAATLQNQMPVGGALDNADAASNLCFKMNVFDANSTSLARLCTWAGAHWDGNNVVICNGSGGNSGTGAISGIRFLMSSGNISVGTFRLYGIRK